MKARIKPKKAKVFKQLNELEELASQIPNQTILDVVMTQEKDLERRKELFRFIKQFITFPNPQMSEAENPISPVSVN